MDCQTFLIVFGVGVAVVAGIVRWLGVPRWLAFSIPSGPLLVLFLYTFYTGAVAGGEGGGVPWWLFTGLLVLIALPISAITVFIIPKRHGKPSA